jgi:hypothetical protein
VCSVRTRACTRSRLERTATAVALVSAATPLACTLSSLFCPVLLCFDPPDLSSPQRSPASKSPFAPCKSRWLVRQRNPMRNKSLLVKSAPESPLCAHQKSRWLLWTRGHRAPEVALVPRHNTNAHRSRIGASAQHQRAQKSRWFSWHITNAHHSRTSFTSSASSTRSTLPTTIFFYISFLLLLLLCFAIIFPSFPSCFCFAPPSFFSSFFSCFCFCFALLHLHFFLHFFLSCFALLCFAIIFFLFIFSLAFAFALLCFTFIFFFIFFLLLLDSPLACLPLFSIFSPHWPQGSGM